MKQRRVIALLVAVMMILPLFAVPGFATDTVELPEETTVLADEGEEPSPEESTEDGEATEAPVTEEPESGSETTEEPDTAHTTPVPDSEEESVTSEPESVPETGDEPETTDVETTEEVDETTDAETTEEVNETTDAVTSDADASDVTTLAGGSNLSPDNEEAAEPDLELTVTDDLAGGHLKLGDTITCTVKIIANHKGFCYGTFFFRPSENLRYESSTMLGVDTPALPVENPDHEAYGAIGITVGSLEDYTQTGVYITVTFRVVNVGDATVEFFPYELVSTTAPEVPLVCKVNGGTVIHTVPVPDKPVIATDSLPEGIKDVEYSTILEADLDEDIEWEIAEGSLPAGLTLLPNGTLSGTPTEFGVFTFSVKVVLLGVVESEAKELTITILEKPRKLSLTDSSDYTITEDDYLVGVRAQTKLMTLLSTFKNAENVKVYNASGEMVIDLRAFVGTGYTVSLVIGDEKIHTVTVVVLGDVGGDGEIGSNDYTLIRAHYLEKKMLEGAYLMAARVTGQETVGTGDYIRVRAHYLEKINLYE